MGWAQRSPTRAAALFLDGEAEALTLKAVELALAGDPVALRLRLDRIVAPRHGRPVEFAGAFALPPLANARDLAGAMSSLRRRNRDVAGERGDDDPERGCVRSHDASPS